jgi:predicted nucleic acid-binding protein
VYLLDTNIVSEMRRPRPHPAVAAWIAVTPGDRLFVSAVTLGELQAGVEITRQQDPARAAAIEDWIDAVAATHNILPMDSATFRQWARLMHRRSPDLIEDAMIAATAIVYNLTVATRNLRDFKRFGVPVFNPFEAAP